MFELPKKFICVLFVVIVTINCSAYATSVSEENYVDDVMMKMFGTFGKMLGADDLEHIELAYEVFKTGGDFGAYMKLILNDINDSYAQKLLPTSLLPYYYLFDYTYSFLESTQKELDKIDDARSEAVRTLLLYANELFEMERVLREEWISIMAMNDVAQYGRYMPESRLESLRLIQQLDEQSYSNWLEQAKKLRGRWLFLVKADKIMLDDLIENLEARLFSTSEWVKSHYTLNYIGYDKVYEYHYKRYYSNPPQMELESGVVPNDGAIMAYAVATKGAGSKKYQYQISFEDGVLHTSNWTTEEIFVFDCFSSGVYTISITAKDSKGNTITKSHQANVSVSKKQGAEAEWDGTPETFGMRVNEATDAYNSMYGTSFSYPNLEVGTYWNGKPVTTFVSPQGMVDFFLVHNGDGYIEFGEDCSLYFYGGELSDGSYAKHPEFPYCYIIASCFADGETSKERLENLIYGLNVDALADKTYFEWDLEQSSDFAVGWWRNCPEYRGERYVIIDSPTSAPFILSIGSVE